MQITLNGEARTIHAKSVAALVAELGQNPTQVAIERNGEIVPKSQHERVMLSEGDKVEVVQIIGGG